MKALLYFIAFTRRPPTFRSARAPASGRGGDRGAMEVTAGRNGVRVGADLRRRDRGVVGAEEGGHGQCKGAAARGIEGTLHRVFLPIMLKLPISSTPIS